MPLYRVKGRSLDDRYIDEFVEAEDIVAAVKQMATTFRTTQDRFQSVKLVRDNVVRAED